MATTESRSRTWTFLAVTSLLLTFLLIPLFATLRQDSDDPLVRFAEKISPVLRDEVAFLRANPKYDYLIPVIIEVNREFFVRNEENRRYQGSRQVDDVRSLSLVNGYATKLSAAHLQILLKSELIEYVTLDAVMRADDDDGPSNSSNPFVATIGADKANASGYSGKGVVVAVFDSGIGTHPDLEGNRTIAAVDFTSGKPVINRGNRDDYGHGTHVAGIIGGTGRKSNGRYIGVAPEAKFVDIKVVGADGSGLKSNVISAIDWAIQNKDKYDIRIGNFSLSSPPAESYKKDPVCKAIERLATAEIIPVLSGGNWGRTQEYAEIWRSIGSPGISPFGITAYPMNTLGTVTHADDKATTYGSRGPSIDFLFKSDVSAPGNRIPSLLAKGSALHRNYPEFQVDENYIILSGASMATAFVSGTVALMLEANPALNFNLTKLICLLTAIKSKNAHMLEQGNGLVNAKTAVDLAKAVDVKNQTLKGPVSPSWTSKDEQVWAGGAFAYGDQIIYSNLVNPQVLQFWGEGRMWTDAINRQSKAIWLDGLFPGGSLLWSDKYQVIWSDKQQVIWSDKYQVIWSDLRQVIWSDRQQVIWSDKQQVIWSDKQQVIWSDWKQVIWSDDTTRRTFAGDSN